MNRSNCARPTPPPRRLSPGHKVTLLTAQGGHAAGTILLVRSDAYPRKRAELGTIAYEHIVRTEDGPVFSVPHDQLSDPLDVK